MSVHLKSLGFRTNLILKILFFNLHRYLIHECSIISSTFIHYTPNIDRFADQEGSFFQVSSLSVGASFVGLPCVLTHN